MTLSDILGWFLVTSLFSIGLLVTWQLRGIQFTAFWHAIKITLGCYSDKDEPGEISHFAALCTALSGTLGLGNISGVAIAITVGGPGAIFWMFVIGIIGMALKYAECTLSHLHRRVNPIDGTVRGGPMYVIEDGLGRSWKPMALFFAAACVIETFGATSMFQTNQLASTFKESFGITPILTGVVVSTLVGFVIFGGIKRIGAVTTFMVPFMSGIYMLAIVWILVTHADRLPGVLSTILHSAFHGWTAPAGGLAGFTVAQALIHGVRRACFSNEAGMGSAAIAHSAAITHEPIREGCVALLEPFLDTVVMCTAGALVVLMADTWHESSNGVVITAAAFNTFIPGFGTYFIPVAVFFFATASLLGWSYYGEQAFAYLTDGKSILIYKFAFLAFAVLGSVIENVLFIVNFADLAMGFMVIPNLISLVILLPLLRRRTDDYFHAMRHQQPAPALNRPAL